MAVSADNTTMTMIYLTTLIRTNSSKIAWSIEFLKLWLRDKACTFFEWKDRIKLTDMCTVTVVVVVVVDMQC